MEKTMYAPFRWAGSKNKLTRDLFQHFSDSETYVEPFLGSGVVLFRLLQQKKYKRYIVNDINVSIIAFYKSVQEDPELTICKLQSACDFYNRYYDKKKLYYMARKKFNQDKSNFVLFWLLMKAGFNGLYRENRKGFYNVSWGQKKKISFDQEQIRDIHKLIQGVEFHCMDYKEFYEKLESGDVFAYNDPPYCGSQPFSAGGFDNLELAEFVKDYGFDIAISDIDSEQSNKTYRGMRKVVLGEMERIINITAITKRTEVLYTNYGKENRHEPQKNARVGFEQLRFNC